MLLLYPKSKNMLALLALISTLNLACTENPDEFELAIDTEIQDIENLDAFLMDIEREEDFSSSDAITTDFEIAEDILDQYIQEEDVYRADQFVPPFQYIEIVDQSPEENGSGTPGVDICGVYCDCAGTLLTAYMSELSTDDEYICGMPGVENCSANRANPSAAEDTGESCEGASNPSDYVSVGMGGRLSLTFSQSIEGCTVNVVEHWGGDIEGAEVFVCRYRNNESSCMSIGSFDTSGEFPGERRVVHSFLVEE